MHVFVTGGTGHSGPYIISELIAAGGGRLDAFIAADDAKARVSTFAPSSMQSALFMMKNLALRRFSNFESESVEDKSKLNSAVKVLEGVVDDPMFTTRLGKEFRYDRIEQAMAYESRDGYKAVLAA